VDNNNPVQENAALEKAVDKKNKIKVFNIVLAIVMAICLWAYVVGEVNPETKKTITDVPLTVIGESDLEANGLIMLTEISDTVDVVVSGRRSEVYNMTASKVTARLDVSKLHEGENQVSIRVTAPSNVDDVEVKDGDFIIVVDTLVKKEKPVTVSFKGNPGAGGEVSLVKISDETVLVSGPKSLVAKVDTVVGELEVDGSNDTYVNTLRLKPVDAAGKEVKGVTLSINTVSVEAVRSVTKEVPVKVGLVGSPRDGLKAEIESEISLKISGEAEYVKEISKLVGDSVDVSNLTETTTVKAWVQLPQGVNALDSVGNTMEENSSGKVSIDVKIKVTDAEHQED